MINKASLNIRPRRNRSSAWIRDLVGETSLCASDLIMPFFVIDGIGKKEAIKTLPDQYRFSIDLLIKEIQKAKDLGIPAIMLFPATDPKLKTENGDEALNSDNLICRAVREIKKQVPEIGVICDVALDPYTTHGHDGILQDGDPHKSCSLGGHDQCRVKNNISQNENHVLNDETIKILCKQALIQAESGCDIVAPSDMMDGRIGAIRQYLDENGFESVGIMSYAAKYASNFYGAFRNAVGSDGNLNLSHQTSFGANFTADCRRPTLWGSPKSGYQMDFRNSREALREIKLDVKQGADMLIIKPGIAYLDIIAKAKEICDLPIISYQVSTEYAMLKLAAREGLIDFDAGLYESLIAFKRAGASAIISYGAMEIVHKYLSKNF